MCNVKRTDESIRSWVIYKLTSPTGRIYVGKTVSLSTRMNHYKRLQCKTQIALHASLAKYGFENHALEIIESFSSNISVANDKEMFWIRTNMSNKNKFTEQNGLNLTDGGGGCVGHKMSEENKRKLSDMHKSGLRKTRKGVKMKPEAVEAMIKRLTGKPNYKLRGRKRTPEQIKRHSESLKGHTFNRGRVFKKDVLERHIGIHIKAKGKPFFQCTLDGVEIKRFGSLGEASREFKMLKVTVASMLKKQPKNPRCGFRFLYTPIIQFERVVLPRRIFKQQEIKTS